MRNGIIWAGASVLALAVAVEIGGVLYASGILQHNVYGFAGGILAVIGIVAISMGRAPGARTEGTRT
jgi:hypothetical protein